MDRDDPEGIVARFRDRMCPGSYLGVAQFASDSDPDAMAKLHAVAAGTYFRPRDRILRFFDGFSLLPPGLADVEKCGMTAPLPPG